MRIRVVRDPEVVLWCLVNLVVTFSPHRAALLAATREKKKMTQGWVVNGESPR
jgi:hypothetical protein